MCCNLCKFEQTNSNSIQTVDALFRCKIDLYNRGYKADFFRPVTVYYLAYMCFQICTFYNFCREVGQLSGQQHANIISHFVSV